MTRFSNKTVLVTGASRGIGKAVAFRFAEKGAKVAMHYNQDKEAAERALEAMPRKGHLLMQADLADPEATRLMLNRAAENYKRIDIVVNNAGIYEAHPLEHTGYDEWLSVWQRTLAVNLGGPANLCFLAAHLMMAQGGGRIVNISSRGAFRGEPTAPAYGASKAGLNAMSQSLAQALAPHKVYVFVVAPGFVETDMAAHLLSGPEGEEIRNQSPMGRVAHPDEVARTVLFLSSEGTDSLTGSIVDVNGASYLRS